jgi:hypothetical protein
MAKLWTFGCSHVSGHLMPDEHKRWTNILAHDNGLELINLGKTASNNDNIVMELIKHHKDISETDVVFILLTYPERFMYGSKDLRPLIDETYYMELLDTPFLEINTIKNVLAIKQLTNHVRYLNMSSVNNTWYSYFKKYNIPFNPGNYIMLPKVHFVKSFDIDPIEKKHLSEKGHKQMAAFLQPRLHLPDQLHHTALGAPVC